MKPEPRDVHIIQDVGSIESCQLHSQAFRVRGLNAGLISRLKEPLKPFVAKRPYHLLTL